jgi:DNA-binding transcriptional LysR family regulator
LLSELSRRGTIAEVARVVGYTPSAVSQSLAQLEHEAGVALLERDGRRVRLTPAARGLVTRADRVVAELDAAAADLAAAHGAIRGELTVGAFPSAAANLVVPAVRELRERHPELWCAVREHEPEDGISLLRSGELDVLVSESYDDVQPARTGGLERHHLVTEPLLLVLPKDHPAREPVDLTTLREAAWIAGVTGTQFGVVLEQTCRSAGFSPRILHRADDAALHCRLAEAGLGIGLLPAMACTGPEKVRFARVAADSPRRHVSAFVRRGAARRPALAATLDALRRRAGLESRRDAPGGRPAPAPSSKRGSSGA